MEPCEPQVDACACNSDSRDSDPTLNASMVTLNPLDVSLLKHWDGRLELSCKAIETETKDVLNGSLGFRCSVDTDTMSGSTSQEY